jgi:hypothetical protein
MRRKNLESAFAGMSPELRAVYDRLYRRELAYREELFKQHPTFLVNEIPDAYGNRVPTTFIRCWLRHRLLFTFRHAGRNRFPTFQFANGVPKPIIGRVIGLIYPMDGWGVMYWLAAANAWLEEDASPLSLLDSDPDAVLIAASHANDLISD